MLQELSIQYYEDLESHVNIEIMVWISNYIHMKKYRVITHPCPNLLKLRYGQVIPPYIKQ